MANTYFQFKQFKIEQKTCANKVSTDACVFGAFLARLLPKGSVLDVGTGSALLSIMLAQSNKEQITGIEIEENCFQQAIENVKESPFSDYIDLECADIRTWQNVNPFDCVISNPPFFNNTSKNEAPSKNIARQTESLGPQDWKGILDKNAKTSTLVAFLLSKNDVLKAYEDELYIAGYSFQLKTQLYDKENVECKRVILWVSKQKIDLYIPKLFIYKEQDGSYSDEFVDLLKDYYLYL